MTKNKHAIVQGIVISRKNLFELIVVAILLAFVVNLIASYVLVLQILDPLVTVLIGALLCIGFVSYLASPLFSRHVENRSYETFLIYNKKKNEIIPVPRYKFSESVCDYIRDAFVENPALKIIWEKEPLKNLFVTESNKGKNKRQTSAQLLSEAAEYFVLSSLSTHLTDYFAAENFKKENLKEYGREDVPEVLLRNRFLELFSRPMEDRLAFVNETLEEKAQTDGEIVMAYDENAYYEKFELVLPNKSIIRRPADNKIEIETKKLKISLTVRFEGFGTILPEGFEQCYLGMNTWEDINEYKLSMDIQVSMKLRTLFSRTGWEYYYWVDSFLDGIEDEISKDAFFDRIGWETAYTLLQCFNLKHKKSLE